MTTDLQSEPLLPARDVFTPVPYMPAAAWAKLYARTFDGRPYSEDAYPHLTAPNGPFDALEDNQIRYIWLQFASRLGKTFFGQTAQQYFADVATYPMMFASSTESLAKDVVGRTWKCIDKSPRLSKKVPPAHRRKQSRIDFDTCVVAVAWSRSVSTLADKPVRIGHGNEIDKWEHETTSTEADPLKLFTDRGKEFPRRKFILESTPSVKGHSRVETGRLNSDNRSYYVPCPHCKEFQTLKWGDKDKPFGFKWEETDDADKASASAYYECEHCHESIRDHHRAEMMRRGVWAKEGHKVVRSDVSTVVDNAPYRMFGPGWRIEEVSAARNGQDAGFKLSSFYALSLTWGDNVAEFVKSKKNPQDFRNVVNQWWAETWETMGRKQTWEQLYERWNTTDQTLIQRTVPNWARILTLGVDKQQDVYVYVVDAWGPGRTSHTVCYGIHDGLADVFDDLMNQQWHHEDGGKVRIAMTAIDCGYDPNSPEESIYEFCKRFQARGVGVAPIRTMSQNFSGLYKLGKLGADTGAPGLAIIHLPRDDSQELLDAQIHNRTEGMEGCHTIFRASKDEHRDFLEQMLNEVKLDKVDTRNYTTGVWHKAEQLIPNDFRDCRRYAWGAMLAYTRGQPIPPRKGQERAVKTEVGKVEKRFIKREGGWIPKK